MIYPLLKDEINSSLTNISWACIISSEAMFVPFIKEKYFCSCCDTIEISLKAKTSLLHILQKLEEIIELFYAALF